MPNDRDEDTDAACEALLRLGDEAHGRSAEPLRLSAGPAEAR